MCSPGCRPSALLGAKWIDPGLPAELVHTNRRPALLLRVHTDTLLPGETRTIRGLPVTTPARTAFDIGRRRRQQLSKTLQFVDGGAESPYESLTRLLLVPAGFPRPETQIPMYDARRRGDCAVRYAVTGELRMKPHGRRLGG